VKGVVCPFLVFGVSYPIPDVYAAAPAVDYAPVTPSDSTVYNPPFRGIYVGTAGNVVLTSVRGNDCTFKAAAGAILPAGTKVKAATTATDLVALY